MANHKTFDTIWGQCVSWAYKGYEISLADDGSKTFVYPLEANGTFSKSNSHVFEYPCTSIDSLKQVVQWVDNQTKV